MQNIAGYGIMLIVMKVSMQKIAELAGVSVSTVSRVINNNPRISEETRNLVLKVMKEFNYHPKSITSNLGARPTRTIGLIMTDKADDIFENPFFIKAMKGASYYAQQQGYHLMNTFCKTEKEELEAARNYVTSNWADGVVLFTVRQHDSVINFLKAKNYPFAVIGRPDSPEDVLWVDNDNFQAMYQLVSDLIDQGHTSIGFIGGKATFRVATDRFEGYKQALKNRGLNYDEKLISFIATFEDNQHISSEDRGYQETLRILSRSQPDAIVAIDDFWAFGAVDAIKEKGLENISVVGFNNCTRGMYQTPTLTSIDINPEQLGHYAAKLLIDYLHTGKKLPNHYIVDTSIVSRETTGTWLAVSDE